jgi:hypothetical protein
VTDVGKLLIVLGAVLLLAGVLFTVLDKTNFPLGRLPGDIVYRGKEHNFLFSARDFSAGKRGALSSPVCSRAMAALNHFELTFLVITR